MHSDLMSLIESNPQSRNSVLPAAKQLREVLLFLVLQYYSIHSIS